MASQQYYAAPTQTQGHPIVLPSTSTSNAVVVRPLAGYASNQNVKGLIDGDCIPIEDYPNLQGNLTTGIATFDQKSKKLIGVDVGKVGDRDLKNEQGHNVGKGHFTHLFFDNKAPARDSLINFRIKLRPLWASLYLTKPVKFERPDFKTKQIKTFNWVSGYIKFVSQYSNAENAQDVDIFKRRIYLDIVRKLAGIKKFGPYPAAQLLAMCDAAENGDQEQMDIINAMVKFPFAFDKDKEKKKDDDDEDKGVFGDEKHPYISLFCDLLGFVENVNSDNRTKFFDAARSVVDPQTGAVTCAYYDWRQLNGNKFLCEPVIEIHEVSKSNQGTKIKIKLIRANVIDVVPYDNNREDPNAKYASESLRQLQLKYNEQLAVLRSGPELPFKEVVIAGDSKVIFGDNSEYPNADIDNHNLPVADLNQLDSMSAGQNGGYRAPQLQLQAPQFQQNQFQPPQPHFQPPQPQVPQTQVYQAPQFAQPNLPPQFATPHFTPPQFTQPQLPGQPDVNHQPYIPSQQ